MADLTNYYNSNDSVDRTVLRTQMQRSLVDSTSSPRALLKSPPRGPGGRLEALIARYSVGLMWSVVVCV